MTENLRISFFGSWYYRHEHARN